MRDQCLIYHQGKQNKKNSANIEKSERNEKDIDITRFGDKNFQSLRRIMIELQFRGLDVIVDVSFFGGEKTVRKKYKIKFHCPETCHLYETIGITFCTMYIYLPNTYL